MSKLPRVIGISGFARSGKDTVRAHLQQKYGYTGAAFADALRKIMRRVNPVVGVESGKLIRYCEALDLHGYDNAKVCYPLVREMLVAIGVGNRDELHLDIWLDKVIPSNYSGSPIAVSDVRFVNEAVRVVSLKGIVIEVTRPGVTAPNDEEARNHPLLQPYITVTIHNDGTKEELGRKIDAAFEKLGFV